MPHPPEFLPDHPTDRVRPHPRNARDWHRDGIRESLEQNDQYRPLIVQRSTNYILAGNGTYSVATEDLGWDRMHVLLIDVDDDTALRILLADNKLADQSGYALDGLTDLLRDVAELPGGLVGTGYDAVDLEELLEEVEQDAARTMETIPSSAPDTPPPGHDASGARRSDDDRDAEPADDGPADDLPRRAPEIAVETVELELGEPDHRRYLELVALLRDRMPDRAAPELVVRALEVVAALAQATDYKPPTTQTLRVLAGLDSDQADA